MNRNLHLLMFVSQNYFDCMIILLTGLEVPATSLGKPYLQNDTIYEMEYFF